MMQRRQATFDVIEMHIAFSVTFGLLLLWYVAGCLRGPAHGKGLDYASYAALFGSGPIAVWGLARALRKVDGIEVGTQMRWAVAIQTTLVVLVLIMLWLPSRVLAAVWYGPACLHAVALVALHSRKSRIGAVLSALEEWRDGILRRVAPLLPASVLGIAIAFSPAMREGLGVLLHSPSFVVGGLLGLLVSGVALYLLRHPPVRVLPGMNLAFAVCAALALVLLTNTRLNFDWIHYGTYVGPANAVVQGRFPLVDVQSQYGVLNYLLYSIAFVTAPHASLSAAATVSALVHAVTYACLVVLLWQLCRVVWFSALFGVVLAYAANHVAPFVVSAYPNFGGMRFFPVVLIAMALVAIPSHRRFTALSVAAYAIALLWSFEATACAIGAYAAYLALREGSSGRYGYLLRLVLLTLGVYVGFGLLAVAFTGSLLRFDLYLSLVFSYVNPSAYSGANWLKAIDPKELIWVPLVALYFGVLSTAWKVLADREPAMKSSRPSLFIARITAVTVCGVLLLSLFVLRSLMVYLLIVIPLGLTLLAALTARTWSASERSFGARLALGLPFAMVIGTATGLLGNIFFESDGAKVIAHDYSAAYDFARTGRSGFKSALLRLQKEESDYEIGMSFPWKPDRLREAVDLMGRWFPKDGRVLVFMPETAAVLLKTGKAHLFPTAYTVSELGSERVSQFIVAAEAGVREGTRMLVVNHPNELDRLETRMLQRLLGDWDAIPLESGRFSTVYHLSRKVSPAPAGRLSLALPVATATASSQMSRLYSATSAGDSWEATFWSTAAAAASSDEWLEIDLGEQEILSKIELVPFWPVVDAFPKRFSVLVSSDGSAWSKVAEEESYSPDWSNYATRPISGYRIDLGAKAVRYIRLEAAVPFSKSQGTYLLQVADILSFGRRD